MRKLRWLLGGLMVSILGGCPESSETTCAIALSISGDLTAALTMDSSVACGIQHSYDSGIDVGYLPTGDGALASVDLTIDEVTRGETGAGFPAALRINHSDGRAWIAECTVSLKTHELRGPVELGEEYRVVGHGECPAPATGESGSVTVMSFDFIVHATWGS